MEPTMHLVATPRAPIPEGAHVFALTTQDGITLRVAKWERIGPEARGTVVLAQGRTEFIEKYFEVIDELRRRGFAVVTFDWRGQGLSQRLLPDPLKGHVTTFSAYDRDLEMVMREVALAECRPPFFGMAHSMGGAVMLRALARGHEWFERVILNAPMVAVHPRLNPGLGRVIGEAGGLIGLAAMQLPTPAGVRGFLEPFEGNRFTHDEARYLRIREQIVSEPRLQITAPTLGWARAAGRATAELQEPAFADRIHTPLLIVAAGNDTIVSTVALEQIGRRLKTGHTLVVDEARHEILMETDPLRAQFWAAFDAFIPGERAGL